MQIRWASENDTEVLAQVFYRSVRDGASPYTAAQRAAWMPHVPDQTVFGQRLALLWVVAAQIDGQVCGFMATSPSGYIDLAYILPEHRKSGTFRKLYEASQAKAETRALDRLWTHASLTAKPAFRAMGFSVIHHEKVERAGEILQRAQMEKYLI